MERYTEAERLEWIQEQMDALIQDSPVKVFAASNSPLIPFRLTNAKNYRPNHGYRARELILDSGVGMETDNGHVISAALKMGDCVDWVVPKDYPNRTMETIESLKEFKLHMPDSLQHKLLIPLQGSTPEEYVECYNQAREIFPDQEYFGFGGIAGAALTTVPNLQPLPRRMEAVRYLLDHTDVKQLHLFGCTNIQWLNLYQDERIVSCDSARFGQQAKTDAFYGKHGGVMSYFAIAAEWVKFLTHLVNPDQTRSDEISFDGFFEH